MSRYAKLARKPVPQTEALDAWQVENNVGGFVYALDKWKRLERFLILGSDTNTYYQKAPQLTRQNAACVTACADEDHIKTVNTIVTISVTGRAAKNDSAIFALALVSVHAKEEARSYAFSQLNAVCRTATHLFQFIQNRLALGAGWGRGFKRAVAHWYDGKTVEDVAFQAIKYRTREGYTHKRALECSRAFAGGDETRRALYGWMKEKPFDGELLAKFPYQLRAHISVMEKKKVDSELLHFVKEYRLPWEAVPTEVKKSSALWEAMLPHMGLTALVRNLGAMTAYGALKPLKSTVKDVVARLTDDKALKKAQIHPFNLLVARVTYENGTGFRGEMTWDPFPQITDALEAAFYKSFEFVEPSNKRTLIGLDVSGSMSSAMNNSPVSCAQGAAAMAMTIMRTEPSYHCYGFTDSFRDLKLRAGMSLAEVLQRTEDQNFGGTDCALPMLYARKKDLEVDTFMIFTDNETYMGHVHPKEALKQYRKASGIDAKLIVVGMTSTGFSIADPMDPGMLDVVGFDAAAPTVMAAFSRG